MAAISAKTVKELREKTGAGMMDCKQALAETGGDLEKAVDFLREKGLATAQKKSSRVTKEGAVDSYIHAGGKIGVLVEVDVETDFVARSDPFKEFTHDLAMQVAASNPLWVRREEVPDEVIEREQGDLSRAGQGQARQRRREDDRGQAEQVLRRRLPHGTAVREGSGPHRRAAAHRPRGRHRRERRGAPLRALPARRQL